MTNKPFFGEIAKGDFGFKFYKRFYTLTRFYRFTLWHRMCAWIRSTKTLLSRQSEDRTVEETISTEVANLNCRLMRPVLRSFEGMVRRRRRLPTGLHLLLAVSSQQQVPASGRLVGRRPAARAAARECAFDSSDSLLVVSGP